MAAKQQADSGASSQLGEQGRGGIKVRLVAVGRVGPNRIINNFRGLFVVHMQSGFQAVGLLARIAIAAMAYRSGFSRPGVLMIENTAEGGFGIDLGMRSKGV
jgi:hypothetical protein